MPVSFSTPMSSSISHPAMPARLIGLRPPPSQMATQISVQVLNELTNVACRKMRMSWDETHAFPNTLRGLLTVHPLTVETHETGLRLAERYGLSIYDAMIAASALHAGCDTLWSEDLQDGMMFDDGLRIANPFRGLSALGATAQRIVTP